jgi:hypothetical protein
MDIFEGRLGREAVARLHEAFSQLTLIGAVRAISRFQAAGDGAAA